MGLDRCICTNPSQGTEPPSSGVVARTVEALLGAIWVDSQGSMQSAKQAMLALELLQEGIDL